MSIYTDLAMEARELHPGLTGVTEQREEREGIVISRIRITGPSAAEKLGKRMGNYVTIDAPELAERPPELIERTAGVLASELRRMLGNEKDNMTVLTVGLGNRAVTPDSLGPRTAERVFVTRHIKAQFPDAFDHPAVSSASLAPGVLGTTGIETSDLVKGVCERIRPDAVIVVDSLASRRAARISTTIQLSDAGIDPGSGVGNIRAGLNSDILGIPVIAVGVPLVVKASTIIRDAIASIADRAGIRGAEEKLEALAESAAESELDGLIVTPKDIDTIVSDMSGLLAEGINHALFGEYHDEIMTLLT
ncbi:MAG: GPR endopeptidase [Clostridia bacterium]|nr:GPR endopeptidase [Clostridia bacterium]